MEHAVQALKAAGEPTRFRILAILDRHELSVGELVQILGQSQPRVSRHLKVLSDAGLVRRHQEGTSAFYRIDREGSLCELIDAVLSLSDPADAGLQRDGDRLRRLRQLRAERAEAYFKEIAADWDRMRNLHVPDADIETALLQTVTGHAPDTVVDLGTGTGRVLELLAPHIGAGIGIDFSRDMLAVARNKLDSAQLHHCQVRHGDIHRLDLPDGAADVVVLHHVLHFLDDPDHAIAEAARLLGPSGLLVVIDFAPHGLEELRADYAHVRLGFAGDEMASWCRHAGLQDVNERQFVPLPADKKSDETLTVSMWTAKQRSDVTSTYNLEVA